MKYCKIGLFIMHLRNSGNFHVDKSTQLKTLLYKNTTGKKDIKDDERFVSLL